MRFISEKNPVERHQEGMLHAYLSFPNTFSLEDCDNALDVLQDALGDRAVCAPDSVSTDETDLEACRRFFVEFPDDASMANNLIALAIVAEHFESYSYPKLRLV
jgi:hypothetical protein